MAGVQPVTASTGQVPIPPEQTDPAAFNAELAAQQKGVVGGTPGIQVKDVNNNPIDQAVTDANKDAWFKAVATGDEAKVRELINTKGFDVNVEDSIGGTALHHAHMQPAIAKLLIEEGKIDITKVDKAKMTAYDNAKYWGEPLPASGSTSGRDGYAQAKQTADYIKQQATEQLKTAGKNGDWVLGQKLIRAGGDQSGYDKNNNIMGIVAQTAWEGTPEQLKTLIEGSNTEIDLGRQFADGSHSALKELHEYYDWRPSDRVKQNIDYLQTKTNEQFRDAIYADKEDKAILLLKAGADVKTAPRKKEDLSLLAVAAGGTNSNLVKAMLEAVPEGDRKAFANQRLENGYSVLHAAAAVGDKVAYDILVKAGANEGQAWNGVTPKQLLAKSGSLETYLDNALTDEALNDRPEEGPKYADWLIEKVRLKSVEDVPSFDRTEIYNDPGRYSTEQRARAVVELETALGLLDEGQQKGWDRVDEAARVTNDTLGKTDVIRKHIQERIDKISSPEVDNWLTEHYSQGAEALFKQKPELKQLAKDHAQWMLDDPSKEGFEDIWKSTDDKYQALYAYSLKFEALNTLGGDDGKPAIADPVIADIAKTGHKDEIQKLIANDFGNMNRLNDLIEGKVPGLKKMSPEEATKFLATRISTYGFFHGDTITMERNLKGMVLNYSLDHTDMNLVWEQNDGKSLTEEDYRKLLDTYGQMYPDDLKGLDYELMAKALQKMDATMKAAGYWDMSTILASGPDKLDGITPANKAALSTAREELRKAFRGNIQYAGVIFAGSWLGAHVAKQAGDMSSYDKAKTAGLAMMTLDMGMESLNRAMRNGRYTPTFPWSGHEPVQWTTDGSGNRVPADGFRFDGKVGDWFNPLTGEVDKAKAPNLAVWFNGGQPIPRAAWDAINNLGKVSGGLGLTMLGGLGIASGINMIRSGEKVDGAGELIMGILNSGAGLALTADAASSLRNIGRFFGWNSGAVRGPLGMKVSPAIANRLYIMNMARIAALGAPISFGFNVAGLATMAGFSLADLIMHFVDKSPWEKSVHQMLDPYRLGGFGNQT